jgi:hypothetical protein
MRTARRHGLASRGDVARGAGRGEDDGGCDDGGWGQHRDGVAVRLLIGNVSIPSKLGPTWLISGGDFVIAQDSVQRHRSSMIKENSHSPGVPRTSHYAISRLCSACRSTSSTCSRVTPGNHSRNSSMRAPLSRFSNSALTGTRVLLKSQAPPTFPGTRSTAGHLLQSSMCGNVSDSEPTRKAHDFCCMDDRIVLLKIGWSKPPRVNRRWMERRQFHKVCRSIEKTRVSPAGGGEA